MDSLFIVWKPEYETGITILDEQYRGLVSLINSFFFHRDEKDSDIYRVLVPTAEMFKSYAKINFLTIEKLMRMSRYPDLEKYRAAHEEILHNIYMMDAKYRKNRDAQGLLQYLKEYWLGTVKHHEIQYLDYLVSHFARRDAPDSLETRKTT